MGVNRVVKEYSNRHGPLVSKLWSNTIQVFVINRICDNLFFKMKWLII